MIKPLFIFLLVFLSSCFLNEGSTPNKDETLENYKSFRDRNENKINVITDKINELGIAVATKKNLHSLITADSLNGVIDSIKFLSLTTFQDFKSCTIKLEIEENKCLDFFLIRYFFQDKTKDSIGVAKIEKSPCF